MIVSYHPCYQGDKNILCAGRDLTTRDLEAIISADAVILPQGVGEPLFRLAQKNCPNVFPNFAARFDYPGKGGQIRLFQETDTAHPESFVFDSLHAFSEKLSDIFFLPFPFVIKLDWGGEGDTVFLIEDSDGLTDARNRIALYEKSGQFGFVVQRYVPCGNKSLRVSVIGKRLISYWRIQKDSTVFGTHLSSGATLDYELYPAHQCAAKKIAANFCKKTGINLAGLDFIFPEEQFNPEKGAGALSGIQPLILEINYYFGRQGLGGSEAFYNILVSEIGIWLDETLCIRSE